MNQQTRVAKDASRKFLAPPPGAYLGRLLVILQSGCDITIWDLADNYPLYATAWNLLAQETLLASETLVQRQPSVRCRGEQALVYIKPDRHSFSCVPGPTPHRNFLSVESRRLWSWHSIKKPQIIE